MKLREATLEDARFLYSWRMADEARKMFLNTEKPSYEQHLAFLEKSIFDGDKWFVLTKDDDEPVGSMALYNFADDKISCEWGRIVIAEKDQGKGFARMMLALVIQQAVSIGIDAINAEVLEDNVKSLNLHRSMGFKDQGSFNHKGRVVLRLRMKLSPIQVLKPYYRTAEVLREIGICLDAGWTGLGFKTLEFEEAWKLYTELPHAHFVSSCTAALHLAVKTMKDYFSFYSGDEIITTPLTFVSTNHVILQSGLKPVFADVDEHLCMDPFSFEDLITPRTRAVMFVGLGGNVGQWEKIKSIAKARGLFTILDAAHMAGTWMKNHRHAGYDADATAFSFHSVKNLPTADSGMVCFKSKKLDEHARKLSWLGISKDTYTRTSSAGNYKWKYDVEHVGFKCHGNSVMAAMGLVGLRWLEADNAFRRALSERYDRGFAGCSKIRTIPMADDCLPSRHLYQVRVKNRDEIMVELNKANIFPGVHYDDNTSYRMYSGDCPRAKRASGEIISLPLHLKMQTSDVDRVVGVLRALV